MTDWRAFYGFYHHGRFVDIGQTDIDVEYIRTGLSLLHSLCDDEVHILFTQSLLKAFFSGRIDPLSDYPDAVDADDRGGSADPALMLYASRFHVQSGKYRTETGNVFRGRTAAASDKFNSDISIAFHGFGKTIRRDIIYSGLRIGKTGIGLDDERQIRTF